MIMFLMALYALITLNANAWWIFGLSVAGLIEFVNWVAKVNQTPKQTRKEMVDEVIKRAELEEDIV